MDWATALPVIWFILIAVLWIGYFVLEGFDFGVGMLLPILGKTEKERRVLINTIGPVWDGNEVWLLTAGGAIFAAFPHWYASLFSGLYLPLFLILIALIIRGVAFEYRGKKDDPTWRARWDLCIIIGSFVPALVWGVGFANFVRGLALDENMIIHTTVGNFFSLFMPYALVGGVLTLTLFLFHGAVFIALKTLGDIRERARAFAAKVGIVVIVVMAAFTIWTAAAHGAGSQSWQPLVAWVLAVLAIVTMAAAWFFNSKGREGWAFLFSAVGTLALFAQVFVAMFPNVIASTLNPEWSMSVWDAASTPYTLTIMTWAAIVFVPIVLGYQAWTYWVFRKRLSVANIPDTEPAKVTD